jgi:hypothetical protein
LNSRRPKTAIPFAAVLALSVGLESTSLQTAQAQTALTINNSGFETPVIGNSDGDLTLSHGTPNSATGESYQQAALVSGSFTGWSFAYTSTNGMQSAGQKPAWGVDDPNQTEFTSSEPLPTPFDGNQYFFVNLRASTDGTLTDSGTLMSDDLGALASGTYNLTVAVGARPHAWLGVTYEIGLYDLTTSSYLGTLAHEDLVPNVSASDTGDGTPASGFADNKNIVDLSYGLTLNPGDSSLGDHYAIGINVGENTSEGAGTFTQAILDDTRLTFAAVPEPASMALAGLGLGMLVWSGCRKRA